MEIKYRSTEFTLEQILNKQTFSVPNFQRGIVWSDKKRQKFIETLISGEPFGTILVYRERNNNNVLIDGLQRISTIRAFNENPYKYLKKEIIEDKDVNNLIKVVKKIYRDHELKLDMIEDRLTIDRIKDYIFKGLRDNLDYVTMKNNLLNYLKINLYSKCTVEVETSFKNIIDSVQEKKKIDSLKVYGIEYNGSEENLPNIFYNINTEGVKPSKYEVLASLWLDIKYKIKDDKIINRIIQRYYKLKKNGIKITINKEKLNKEGITLFEYCYAIGSIVMDPNNNYVSFLGKSNNETESVGFEMLCLLLDLKVNEAYKLDVRLNNAPSHFLKDLKNIIVDCLNSIYKALENWVYSEQGEPIRLGNNYMIYHMFIAYAKMNYDIDYKEYKITKKDTQHIKKWNEEYRKNLHLHYLFDYMSNYWNEHRQVTDLTNAINKSEILYKYSSKIDDNEWKEMFNKLKKVQLEENPTQVSNKSKLFVDYLIKFKIKSDPKLKEKYFKSKDESEPLLIDIEHIVPIDRVKRIYEVANVGIGGTHLSSIGNLCYLTAKVNRAKRDKTIYEDQKDRPGYIVDPEFVKFVDYPLEEELKFIDKKFDIFANKFNNFMNDRYDKLVEEFIELKK